VKLVEDEEPEPPRGLHDLVLIRSGEDQLEHHVVGEQNVGRRREDRLPLLVRLLARVAPERDRVRTRPRAVGEELLELACLAVGERVHRINDDRLNALARPVAEHVIDERDEVSKALA
jgi:hypothetical protein